MSKIRRNNNISCTWNTRIEQNLHLPLKSYSPWSLVQSTISCQMKYKSMLIIFYIPSVAKNFHCLECFSLCWTMFGQVKPENCLSIGHVGILESDLCLQWNTNKFLKIFQHKCSWITLDSYIFKVKHSFFSMFSPVK